MAKQNTADPVVQAYARALLELAEGERQADAVAGELSQLRQLWDTEKSFALFLSNPAVKQHERAGVLDRAFAGNASRMLMNFLGVLNVKGRLSLLRAIAIAYQELLDEKRGRVKAEVTVAVPLSESDLEHVRQSLSASFKKDVQVQQKLDESILGGLVVKVEDKLMDASVRAQLETMRKQLLMAKAVNG
jgi:F-type H+-transporting ATPase subunit delta